MQEHSNNHLQLSDGADLTRVSARTELLRAAADDELTPAQAGELDRYLAEHPEDRRVIQFERELRGSIAASVSGAAPAPLRDRITAMRGAAGTAGESIPFRGNTGVSHRRFSRTVRWTAIAACLAIVAGGTLLVLDQQHGALPTGGALVTQAYRTSLVSFIGTQHEECEVYADMIGLRFKVTRLVDVPGEFSKVLGSTPDTGHLEGTGLRFLAAGPCAVPGRGKSVRMVLESTAESRTAGVHGPLVSIHIQQDTGDLNLEPGKTYRLQDKFAATGGSAPEIFVWRRDGFVYFLTSRSESSMQVARAAFGAEEPSGTI